MVKSLAEGSACLEMFERAGCHPFPPEARWGLIIPKEWRINWKRTWKLKWKLGSYYGGQGFIGIRVSQNEGCHFGLPHSKDYSILGSILGSTHVWKLQNIFLAAAAGNEEWIIGSITRIVVMLL